MSLAASTEEARATRRRGESNGATFWLTSYLGANRFTKPDPRSTEAGAVYPVAFLVEQDPEAVVQSHFHQADQFQVVVGGQATLGLHPVRETTVHFAGACSPYGPITAGGDGVTYFTLRNGWDPGARYLPGARQELRRMRQLPHREASAPTLPALDEAARRALAAVACESVIAPEPDGLAAWRWLVPPGATVTGADPAAGRGQMWLVIGGSLRRADAPPLTANSCLFVFPDEPALVRTAGPDGAELLCLQYPRR